MNYPFWDVGIGYGVLMGLVAVVHVFISHFAIGGGLFLVVQERSARRRDDRPRLEFLERLTKVFVLVTLVGGALTGVGIWFVIGLLNPGATELLIHNFVWGWAIEWTFFVVEILAAILYFYGWRRLSARAHMTLGWIYFAAAWLSLAVINGILAFMLTPGRWLETGDFWDGFLNPTYVPTLVLRTGVCLLLAGLYALLVASREKDPATKRGLVRTSSLWALSGLGVAAVSYPWCLRALPDGLIARARDSMPWVLFWHDDLKILAVLLTVAIVVIALLAGERLHVVGAALLMLVGFALFGSFEFLRESVRKPWIVAGYMYGNGIEVAQRPQLAADGLLAHLAYRSGDDGRDLFLHSCRSCHTLHGYKALAPAFDGTDARFIAGVIRGAARVRGGMPSFAGTPAEAETLAAWLAERVDPRPLAEVTGLAGRELGARAYAVRCGKCHVPGGDRDMTATLAGLDSQGLSDFLDTAGEVSDEMPPYTGDATERAALVGYLLEIAPGGAK